jgi:hypothetical protein
MNTNKNAKNTSKIPFYRKLFRWVNWGIIGCIVGTIGGSITIKDWFDNRKPQLVLMVPANWTGIDAGNNVKGLNLLMRISNHSKRNAYLFPETMAVKIKHKGQWYPVEIAGYDDIKYLKTEFSKNKQIQYGINEVEVLKRFDSPVICYDKPLTRYITVISENQDILDNIEGVKVRVEGCGGEVYVIFVDDLSKQQKEHDPQYQYEKF